MEEKKESTGKRVMRVNKERLVQGNKKSMFRDKHKQEVINITTVCTSMLLRQKGHGWPIRHC